MASNDDITSVETLTNSDTETMPTEDEALSTDDKPEFDDREPTSRPESTPQNDGPQYDVEEDPNSAPERQSHGKLILPAIPIFKMGRSNVRLKSNKKQYLEISRIKVLSDGRVLMIDSVNKTLKMFSSKIIKPLCSFSLPGFPNDLDVTGNSEAVVLVSVSGKHFGIMKRYLMFIAVSDTKLSLKSKFEINCLPSKIAVCGDNLLISGHHGSHCLSKIDRNGRQEWRIDLTSACTNIAHLPQENRLVAYDWANAKLTVRDVQTGQSSTEYQMAEKESTEISVDPSGNIFLFCLKKYEILLQVLTADLHSSDVTVLLSESNGLDELPTSIGFDHSRNLLYVSYRFVGNNFRNHVDCFELPNGLYSKRNK